MSEQSLSELLDESSDRYFDMGPDDPALQPEIADPGEYEVTFKSYTTRTDKNGVGQVSCALSIEAEGDFETVWHRLGLPSEVYPSSANRIRIQEIVRFGEAFDIPGKTSREIFAALDEGKDNSSWVTLGTEDYTNAEGVTITRNVVDRFVNK